MENKIKDKEFIGDISGLLRPEIDYNISVAWNYLKKDILSNL